MKKLLMMVCFCRFCLTSYPQDTAHFLTGNEAAVLRYEVQQSADTLNWNTIDTIRKGKNSYAYRLPQINSYFRIKAAGIVNFYTRPILRNISDSVLITRAVFYSTALVWNTAYESNLSYFLIQKTRNGITTKVTNYIPKGAGDYIYKFTKTIYKYTYSIRAVFKDSLKSTPVIFK